jgi:hypothetical protein
MIAITFVNKLETTKKKYKEAEGKEDGLLKIVSQAT